MENKKSDVWGKSSENELLNQENISLKSKIEELNSLLTLLGAEEEKFHSFYETMTEGAAIHKLLLDENDRPVDYIITDCNPSFSKITGIPREKAINALGTKLYGTSKAPYIDIYYEAVKSEKPEFFEVFFGPMQKHFSISVISLKNNNFATIFSDITNRIISETEIRKREIEYRDLANNLPYIISRYDKDFKHLYINSKIETATGIPYHSFIGKSITDVDLPDDYKAIWKEKLQSVFYKRQSVIFEFDFDTPNGRLKYESQIIPEYNTKREVETVLCITRDVTQRRVYEQELIKAKEHAEEMNRIKTNILANISHELRTPMVGILGFSEIIAQDTGEEQTKQMAEMLYESGKRLINTLNQLLDLSRIESKNQIINPVRQNISSCVRRVLSSNEKSAADKNLKVDFICDDDNIFAYLDSYMLNIILDNLISNAIKYTKKGSVTISVFEEKIEDTDYCTVKIKDTGIGISAENMKIIFDEFRQVSEGYGRVFEGTGLGLTITKKFTEMLSGKLHIDSELYNGTTVTLTLPLNLNKEIPENEKPDVDRIIMNPKNDMKNILLVDDDDFTRDFVKALLSGLYNVEFANNAIDALDKINRKNYELILLDINLGVGMDGLELLSIIRNKDGYKDTPVVAVTASTMEGDKNVFLSKGCDDYLGKPFEKKHLISVIEKNLKELYH
jgi:PAS domain S-box-containing protein